MVPIHRGGRCPGKSCRDCFKHPKPESDDEWEPPQPPAAKRARSDAAPARSSELFKALSRRFPIVNADPMCNSVAAALRQLDKYEIAVQGDDYDDRDCQKTNTEALQYARCAGVVQGLGWSLTDALRQSNPPLRQRLEGEPYIGSSQARKIMQLATTGTCDPLEAFRAGRPPLRSTGEVRVPESGRSLGGGHAKWELSRLLGLSAMRACKLVDHQPLFEDQTRLSMPVRSAEALLALPEADRRLLHGGKASFEFGLRHRHELCAAVSEAEAREMGEAVLGIARKQHSERVGAPRDCRAPGGGFALCDCCWQLEFVGGARRRGTPGHDADLLLWHRHEEASCGEGDACVLLPLVAALTEQGLLLPGAPDGWRMVTTAHHRRAHFDDGGVDARKHRAENRTSWSTPAFGHANLTQDAHDRCFGVWRTAGGQVRRVDIVVCAVPEELPFALLSWTGSRTLNRLMRLHAETDLGLRLTPHGLFAKGDRDPDSPWSFPYVAGTSDTRVALSGGRSIVLKRYQPVPYDLMRTEEDILRLLACGTDAFCKLYDPTNRNC
jgi:DNA polymerase mu